MAHPGLPGYIAMLTLCSLEISLPMHAFNLFCPASLVIARSLATDAFRTSFATLDELVNRPLFDERTTCIPLPWKKELLDDEIFPISYNRYFAVWKRTTSIAGYPEDLRPYAVRIGAGSRLDGIFQQSPLHLYGSNALLTCICIQTASLQPFGITFSPIRPRCIREVTKQNV